MLSSPKRLDWALLRDRKDPKQFWKDKNNAKFLSLRGNEATTIEQLEKFAQLVNVPVGYLIMREPPDEKLPIADLRSPGNSTASSRPSPELLETIYTCQRRQDWYRDYLRAEGKSKLSFVNSVSIEDDEVQVAEKMRQELDFDFAKRSSFNFRALITKAEEKRILVMINGIVLNNTRRRLDLAEFRGFALVDPHAPLIFINGKDPEVARFFSLAHELAHIWLGETGLSGQQNFTEQKSGNTKENWCNRVAAEFLVPRADLKKLPRIDNNNMPAELERLAKRYKVSKEVILRRLLDTKILTWSEFQRYLKLERKEQQERLADQEKKSSGKSGGDYYATLSLRVSKRFARALIASTLRNETLYRDSLRLLSINKLQTFDGYCAHLGIE